MKLTNKSTAHKIIKQTTYIGNLVNNNLVDATNQYTDK